MTSWIIRMIEPSSPDSHFMQLCRLASYGFNVVPGSLVSPRVGRLDYEFEPSHSVRLSQIVNGRKIEKTILFSDLFKVKP